MKITKRTGELVDFDPTKILERIKEQCKDLNVDFNLILIELMDGLYDGIPTVEIDMLTARTAANYITTHPDYDTLASRMVISRLLRETPATFRDYLELLSDKVDRNKMQLYYQNVDPIEVTLQNTEHLNYNYDFFGINTALKIYLLKDENDRTIEKPTYMYMRVALALGKDYQEAIEFYDVMVNHKVSVATPILLSAGTYNQNMISCNLSMLSDDSLEGIIDTIYKASRASADGAGIGLYLGSLRSSESKISSTGGNAAGVVRVCKMINEAMKTFNQRGKRNGSAAVYLDVWHKDIVNFLQLRLAGGSDEMRARDLFLAVSIPNNFMHALINEEDYYLFCPHQVEKATGEKIYELYGEQFEALYNKCKDMGLGTKIKASEIWLHILKSQSESGLPYIYYVDNANLFHNHNHWGKIKASNLCAEILQYQAPNTTAQCCLGAIPVGKYDDNDIEKHINSYVQILTRLLNRVIDQNHYSTECAQYGGLTQRAIAIGIVGFADYLAKQGVPFESEAASNIAVILAHRIFINALQESNRLAKEEFITHDDWNNSHYGKGEFKPEIVDYIKNAYSELYNDIKTYGLANSLFTAYMPTASTSQLLSLSESFEPFTSNVFTRKTLAGEFVVINKYLINDLIKYELWNEDTRKELILNNGSVQAMEFGEHTEYFRNLYKTIYEIPQRVLIDLAVARAPWTDQSQSMNLYVNEPNSSKMSSMLRYAWEKGLATGCYYMRSKPKAEANKTLGFIKTKSVKEKPEDGLVDCFGCNV